MRERRQPTQRSEVFWHLVRVWLIYLPWGWLLAVLSAPSWVIVIFIFLIWSTTDLNPVKNRIFNLQPTGVCGCFLKLLIELLLMITIIIFIVGIRLLPIGIWMIVPSATLISCIILCLFPLALSRIVPRISAIILRQFWLISILLMYYWIFNLPRLFQNVALLLPPGENWGFDWNTFEVIGIIVMKIFNSLSTVDITLALFVSWLSSLVCITFPAHKTLLQAISPSQAAVVLTFIGGAGFWSGWFVEKFIF